MIALGKAVEGIVTFVKHQRVSQREKMPSVHVQL